MIGSELGGSLMYKNLLSGAVIFQTGVVVLLCLLGDIDKVVTALLMWLGLLGLWGFTDDN